MPETSAEECSRPEEVSKQRGREAPLSDDAIVGARIRARRVAIGMTQQTLATRIGVSFQQVQKYEKGISRIGVVRLRAIAQTLKTTPGFFFATHNETSSAAIAEILILPRDTSVVATRIRNKRKALRMSQQVLAAKIGVSTRLIQRYEQGECTLRVSRVLAIARALDMSQELSVADAHPITIDDAARYAASSEGLRLNHAAAGIVDPATRWRVIEFAEELRRNQFPLVAME